MITCAICKIERMDLTRHIKEFHRMTVEDYKKQYQVEIVDPLVDIKRKETSMERYGDPNYKNEEAKKLSNEIFEGGHSLSDPEVREKACETKMNLYGDPNFTNREKAQQTLKEKYGVTNISHIPGVIEKRIDTLKARYGKIFNWEREDLISREDLIRMHHEENLSLAEIGKKFNIVDRTVAYWMKKHGVEVHKKIVSPKFKEYTSAEEAIKEYFEYCLKNKLVLSFNDFGSMTEDRKMQKLKRLFNSGKIYSYLKEELKVVALQPELWPDFFKKIL